MGCRVVAEEVGMLVLGYDFGCVPWFYAQRFCLYTVITEVFELEPSLI
jgi:hypothetical protein